MFLRQLGEHGYLIEGTATLAKENINKVIPYKYWVSCGQGSYEFIYKDPVSSKYVNRCLYIRGDLLNSRGEFCCWVRAVGGSVGFGGRSPAARELAALRVGPVLGEAQRVFLCTAVRGWAPARVSVSQMIVFLCSHLCFF